MTLYGYAGKILRLDLTQPQGDRARHREVPSTGAAVTAWARRCSGSSARTRRSRTAATRPTSAASPPRRCAAPACPRRPGAARWSGVGVGYDGISWFTRSGFGGRFSTMLKYAGWDAIVIEGKADKPVWVDIRNDTVIIRDAAGLWGKDTWTTQQEIWKLIGIETGTHTGWDDLDDLKDAPKRESRRRRGERRRSRRSSPSALPARTRLPRRADPRRRQWRRPGRLRGGLGLEEPEGDQRHRHRLDQGRRSEGAHPGPAGAEGQVHHQLRAARLPPVVAHRRARQADRAGADPDRGPAAAGLPGLRQRLPVALEPGLRQRVGLPGDVLVQRVHPEGRQEPEGTRRDQPAGGRPRARRTASTRSCCRPGLPWLEYLHEEGVLGPREEDPFRAALGEARDPRVRREAHPRAVHRHRHRQGPGRRLGAGGPQVGPREGPAHRRACSSRTGAARSTATTRAQNWSGATAASWATATRTPTASTSCSRR